MVRSFVSGKLTVNLTGTLRNTLTSGEISSVPHPALAYTLDINNGIDANQANRSWQRVSGTIAAGANLDIDLSTFGAQDIGAGAGRDGVGQTISPYEQIVAIALVNENAIDAAGALEFTGLGPNNWQALGDHTVANDGALLGQGILLKCNPAVGGLDITVLSEDIRLTANGGAVNYSLYIIARHDEEVSSSSSSSSSPSSTSSISTSPSSSSWSSTSTSSSISTSSTSSSSPSSVSSSSWSSQS